MSGQARGFRKLSAVSWRVAAAISFTVVLAACPNPIPGNLAEQIADETSPEILIVSPEDRSEYSTVVQVEGRAIDDTGDAAVSGYYELKGTSVGQAFVIDDDGAFLFSFATRDADGTSVATGTITLDISVADSNGNDAFLSMQLVEPEDGDIPGFSATPGDSSMLLEWEDVPGAESYTLYETYYGQERLNVQSPYAWDGLSNGTIYSFQVEAVLPESTGDNALSQSITKMPLSPRDFAPWINSNDYQAVTLEWNGNSNVDYYVVERQQLPAGAWKSVRVLPDTLYTDFGLDPNTSYAYRIRPRNYPDITSAGIDAYPGSIPSYPGEVVSEQYTSDSIYNIAVAGAQAYTVHYNTGMGITNISDPENPGQTSYTGDDVFNIRLEDVEISGDYAFVASQTYGLGIADISDPTNPGDFTFTSITGGSEVIHLDGDRAFVRSGMSNFAIVDISDPENPGAPDYVTSTDQIFGIDVFGEYAYLALYATAQISVIDVSDSTAPGTPENVTVSNYPLCIVVHNGYAYAGITDTGIAILDVSDPENPGAPSYVNLGESVRDLAVRDNTLYFGTDSGFGAMDITTPLMPGTPVVLETGSVRGIGLTNSHAFLGHVGSQLTAVEFSQAARPQFVSSVSTGSAEDIAIAGGYAWIAAGYGGLARVDISNPESPAAAEYFLEAYRVHSVEISGDYAFLGCNSDGVAIIDITDPASLANPVFVDTASFAYAVTVAGHYAYVADWNSGVGIIDITNPLEPVLLGYEDTDAAAWDIAITGEYAYVTGDGLNTVERLHIPQPGVLATPQVVHTTTAGARRLVISGSNLYVGEKESGLSVIDISEPLSPGLAEYLDTTGETYGAFVSNSYAFIADGDSGLEIVDMSDLSNPISIARYDTPGLLRAVAVVGDYAYLADDGEGLLVLRLFGE